MDKRGFKKMFLLVIAFVIIILLIIYLVVTPRTRESLEKLSQAEVKETTSGENQQAIDPQLSNKKYTQNKPTEAEDKTFSNEQITALDNELLPRRYHDDIYVEAYSIISEKFLCFTLDFTPRMKSHLKTSFAASDRQSQLNNIINQCQKELKIHPLLVQNGENLGQTLKPSSELGRLIKNLAYNTGIDAHSKDFQYQTLLAVLKTKNGPLIASQAIMPFAFFSEGEIIPISTWVGSRDFRYIEQIFQLAMTQMACRYQGGIACQPQGMVMTMNCISHQPACGLDFQSYYQQNILPGMQKDVDILVEKFEAMAE